MPVITLTTDLGLKDHYVAAVKGYLLAQAIGANIADISHQIPPFNLAEASFILGNCYREFPSGTIHLVSVESNSDNSENFILVKSGEHLFILRDNGLISLVLKDEPELVIKLDLGEQSHSNFPLREIMAPAACRLLKGAKPEELGERWNDFDRKAHLSPIIQRDLVRGTVIYIDNYGNAITNIRLEHIERVRKERRFAMYFSRNDTFTEFNTHYAEVPEGEKLCLFNSTGHLEIAINKGNASGLLGLEAGRTILIEFQ